MEINQQSGPSSNMLGDMLHRMQRCYEQTGVERNTSEVRSDWRRLSKPISPFDGESLRSMVYRSCTINNLPNSWGLLGRLGLSHRNRVVVAEEPELEVDQLAYALGVQKTEVAQRRYELLVREHRSFFGLNLNRFQIENRVRCFSPAAFRYAKHYRPSVGDPIFAWHHATWELRDIPFCLQHWDMLQTTCWCEPAGVVQGWTRTATFLHECDRCGDDLSAQESSYVPEPMRPVLATLRAFVDPIASIRDKAAANLPPELRRADRSKVFALIIKLRSNINVDLVSLPIGEPVEQLLPLWQACSALLRGPEHFYKISFRPDVSEESIRLIRRFWLNTLEGVHAPANPLSRSTPPKRPSSNHPVGIRRAVAVAGMSSRALRIAADENLISVESRFFGGKKVYAFNEAELVEFGKNWRRRIEPQSLAEEFGISYNGIEQLAAMGLLKADAPALMGTGPHCNPEIVEGFLAQIEQVHEAGALVAGSTISLIKAMRYVSGRTKPWGPVLNLILNKKLPFDIVPGPRLSDSIIISQCDVQMIEAAIFNRHAHNFPFATTMNQRDALGFFNISPTHSRILAGLGQGSGEKLKYFVEDIEALAKRAVTIPEIALALEMPPADTFWHLKRAGESEFAPGLWDRRILQQANAAKSIVDGTAV